MTVVLLAGTECENCSEAWNLDLLDIWDSRFEKSLVLVGVSLFSNGTGIEFREKHRIFKKSLRIKCYRIS